MHPLHTLALAAAAVPASLCPIQPAVAALYATDALEPVNWQEVSRRYAAALK